MTGALGAVAPALLACPTGKLIVPVAPPPPQLRQAGHRCGSRS